MSEQSASPVVPENRLAMTHGLRAVFTSGRLPRGCSYVRRTLNRLRTEIEQAVVAEHGSDGLTFYRKSLIQTALTHEAAACLILRWLRKREDSLTNAELLAYASRFGSERDARDKCLRLLGLDRNSKPDVWAVLYGRMPSNAIVGDLAAIPGEELEGK
jgi:hypothetical protein